MNVFKSLLVISMFGFFLSCSDDDATDNLTNNNNSGGESIEGKWSIDSLGGYIYDVDWNEVSKTFFHGSDGDFIEFRSDGTYEMRFMSSSEVAPYEKASSSEVKLYDAEGSELYELYEFEVSSSKLKLQNVFEYVQIEDTFYEVSLIYGSK